MRKGRAGQAPPLQRRGGRAGWKPALQNDRARSRSRGRRKKGTIHRAPTKKEPARCRRYEMTELEADPSPPFATIFMPAWRRKRDRVPFGYAQGRRDDSKAAFYLLGSYRIAI